MWYLGSMVIACDWSGIGAEGSAAAPAQRLVVQPGDRLRNARARGRTQQRLDALVDAEVLGRAVRRQSGDRGCTTDEYGNLYSPMGRRLRPLRRDGQVVRRLLRRVQRREGDVDRDVQPACRSRSRATASRGSRSRCRRRPVRSRPSRTTADGAEVLLPRAARQRDAGRDDADQGADGAGDRGRQPRRDEPREHAHVPPRHEPEHEQLRRDDGGGAVVLRSGGRADVLGRVDRQDARDDPGDVRRTVRARGRPASTAAHSSGRGRSTAAGRRRGPAARAAPVARPVEQGAWAARPVEAVGAGRPRRDDRSRRARRQRRQHGECWNRGPRGHDRCGGHDGNGRHDGERRNDGTAGTTGSGGTTGAAGTTGDAGTTGTPGTAGSIGPGIAGATGAGTGGITSTGGQTTVTGLGGAQAGGSSGEKAGPIVGGCACSASPQGTGMPSLVWIALGAVAASRRRRAGSRR